MFRELIDAYTIQEPFSIVTNRELALMKYIDQRFPRSNYFLCTWHVNMNILANCRKRFLADKEDFTKVD